MRCKNVIKKISGNYYDDKRHNDEYNGGICWL